MRYDIFSFENKCVRRRHIMSKFGLWMVAYPVAISLNVGTATNYYLGIAAFLAAIMAGKLIIAVEDRE